MSAANGNVLHLVDSLGLGGTQTILKGFFEARRDDRSIHLYGLREVPRQIPIDHPNIRVNASTQRFSLMPLADLRRVVRESGATILHCHLFRAQVFGFALKTFFFPNVILVFHEHGRAVGREGESGLEALLFRWFLRLAQGRVDRFVAISDYTRTRLLQLIPEAASRAVVIANAIPSHSRFDQVPDREASRRKHALPPDAFVVGFASRLIERKGWRDFLGAMARVAAGRKVHFLIAGDGEDREKIAAHIRELGLEASGQVLGHIDWMNEFYACLDAFVMPSHWEPHGLAHLEAQAVGIPVIVSNVPGLSATIHPETDALLFEAGDIGALTTHIERLATDPALRERLTAAGRVNAARYTIAAFSSQLEALYAEIRPATRA